jgi:hypothetical protein
VFVDAIEELAERGAAEQVAGNRWLVLLRPPLTLIQVPYFLRRVRLKTELEVRRLASRAGLPVQPSLPVKPLPSSVRPEDE